ncbi:uncharacterized protein MELLADRAFT_123253 [Melampsora larici-populina 98AG31]|uniref:Cysteine proteinase 1, mitochondrial n=1 Tax=Melampsora larici-populina (strain 98AG31 / pathotype 3-4-7) TaxID=747676 RepID=F4RRM0_MELLP|nr:uncharacterized protein MELLADRAFT_123253 [Melampsora larici-populina 98AG31]EGG04950.1 hypothetical protein MELLADRAFT_123253 [Melampsora larici-populina 98AG31]
MNKFFALTPEEQEKVLFKKKERQESSRKNKESRAKTEKTISQDNFTDWRSNFEKDDKAQLASTLLSQQHIPSALLNRKAIRADKRVFSHALTEPPTTFINQHSSGRCWLFAIANMVCRGIIKKFNLGDFKLSQNYLLFSMLLEKSNLYLENMIDLVEDPIDARIISHLSRSPLGDGGQWDTVVGLIEKYGLVPKSVYDESYNSSNSEEIKTFLNSKLRNQAVELRQIYNSAKARAINNLGQDSKSATLPGARAARKAKKAMMAQVYRCLAIALGSPPPPSEAFRWDYLDNSDKPRSLVSTPLDFYNQHCAEFQPSEYISLINDPRNPFNKSYTVDRIGNVWGGRPIRYINTSTDVLKSLVIKMIQADIAVWCGCDVGKMSNLSHGIMDTELINYEAAFGVMSHLSKSERLQMVDSAMTHAMVITAVHLDEQGKPVRYKFENTWSDTACDCAYFVITDAWFDEYVYQIVLHKSFIPDSLRQIYDDPEPSVLPPWDPMGSLA